MSSVNFKVGDVVFHRFHDYGPGRVVKVIPDLDGILKYYTVVFPSGSCQPNPCTFCDWELKGPSPVAANRISKRDYYLGIARAVSMRSTCIRRQYGAVIVRDDAIIATGYNGSARGEANCCDCGSCAREAQGVPHGERYELCVAVHAEANAISQAGRAARGATLYLWGGENGRAIKAVPCMMCERLIKNAGIAEVICGEEEK